MESFLSIISNLLVSLDKDVDIKKLVLKGLSSLYQDQIFDILKACTTERLTKEQDILMEFTEIFEKLKDTHKLETDDSSEGRRSEINVSEKEELLIPIEVLQYAASKDSSNKEIEVWKTCGQTNFKKNLFGYGRSYILDRNEFYYMMKSCYYESEFSDGVNNIIGKYNLEMSLLDSERNLLSSIHDLFAFISSLGHDGFLGSIHNRIPSSIKMISKEVNYGYSFFTLVGGVSQNIKKEEFGIYKLRLLKSVTNFSTIIWNSIKDDLSHYDNRYLDIGNVLAKS
jgi:hypothetical protein